MILRVVASASFVHAEMETFGALGSRVGLVAAPLLHVEIEAQLFAFVLWTTANELGR